ncbi:MAG: succinate dehydrogenase, cytochrome b556 subunit [Burkholderiales bacterium]|nr:succinate dehydrogenase, cytochrome b556 subunit [Burkholderiales bacterium]
MADNTNPPRPVYRNIHITDIVHYRMPLAAIVSILHRISGAIMFLLLPFIIWLFDTSVTSEISYGQFTAAFTAGLGFIPGGVIKVVALGLIWAYLHHLIAGVRHLVSDVAHTVSKQQGKSSAIVTLVLSVALTLVLGAKLFGAF